MVGWMVVSAVVVAGGIGFIAGIGAGEGSERRRILNEKFIVSNGKVYICTIKKIEPKEETE